MVGMVHLNPKPTLGDFEDGSPCRCSRCSPCSSDLKDFVHSWYLWSHGRLIRQEQVSLETGPLSRWDHLC